MFSKTHKTEVIISQVNPTPVDGTDANGLTALMHAIRSKDIKSVKHLILREHAKIDVADKNGQTPLIHAVKSGTNSIVEYLLYMGADATRRDKFGRTALMYAAWKGYPELMGILLRKDSSDRYITDNNGANAIMYAALSGNLECVDRLNRQDDDLFVEDNKGRNLLWYACNSGNPSLVKDLVDSGVDIDHRAENGETPLMHAIRERKVIVSDRLIQLGADVDAQDNNGLTPLMIGIENTFICENLLRANADLDKKDNNGWTAAMHAVNLRELKGLEILINGGANLRLTNNEDKTVFEMIVDKKFNEAAWTLRHALREGKVSYDRFCRIEPIIKVRVDIFRRLNGYYNQHTKS